MLPKPKKKTPISNTPLLFFQEAGYFNRFKEKDPAH